MTGIGATDLAGSEGIPRSRQGRVWAAALVALDLVLFNPPQTDALAGLVVLYLVTGFVPLLWRHRAPVLVFAVVSLHLAVGAAALPFIVPTVPILVGLYTLALERHAAGSGAAWLVALALLGGRSVLREISEAGAVNPGSVGVSTLFFAVFLGAVWGVGRRARFMRRRITTLEERRRRAAAEAVAAERRRIARELHDIVSHSVSVMVLQAAGARRILGRDPLRADQALAQIESMGKESMAELRRLLGVLRDGAFVEDAEEDDAGPQPGLADLPELLARFRSGGLAVRSDVQGTPVRLDASVDLSAYRIVQEALTNVGKHAGTGTTATVRQRWEGAALVLDITDGGRRACGAASPAAADAGLSLGYGLLGLRERARAVGGSLQADALPDGGFQVTASLPLTRPATATTPHLPS